MKVVRRTFDAKRFPKGSPERDRLNNDNLTSEYLPSYRYVLRTDDGYDTPFSYTSKAAAEFAAAELNLRGDR